MTEFIYSTDGYKLDHRRQYPDKTQVVYSNLTARASRIPEVTKAVWFGMRGYQGKILMDNANETFFSRPRQEVTDDYKEFLDEYFGPNDITVEHISELHKLGYIPMRFWSLPEKTEVPLRVPMTTFENTHHDFGWVTNYLESGMSAFVWPGIQSATTALRYRKILDHYCAVTGGDPAFVDYQGHDFSMRGLVGLEAPEIVGGGHLQYFKGTDSLLAKRFLKKYYKQIVGNSVPATEHSVMCAGGEEDEIQTIRRLIKLYPKGIFSVVSDTWDFWHLVGTILPLLKGEIMARDGKMVIRPDSGDPVKIICGDDSYPEGSLQYKGLIECLWEIFGGRVNGAGFKELDSHIGAIYGDSITVERAEKICQLLMAKGFCSTNIVFGIGSYTYQYVTRDTLGQAIKATWALIDGKEKMMCKKPKTDDGLKNSARGRIVVVERNSELVMIDNLTYAEWMDYQFRYCDTPQQDQLKLTWEDGRFVI